MKKANEYNTLGNFALLLLGPPKHGKTRLALSFPKPAVLDCDGNLAGMAKMGIDFMFENPNVDDSGNFVSGAESWKRSVRFLEEAVKMPLSDCETIVIDGFSIMANYLVDVLTQHSKLTVGGDKVMDMSLWQPFRNKIQRFVMEGRASNKRFIVTCHEDIIHDDRTGAVVGYRPLISGQLKHNLAGLFSDCWRVEAKDIGGKSKFLVRFAPKNLMQIGNSLNIPVPELEITGKTPQQVWTELGKFF